MTWNDERRQPTGMTEIALRRSVPSLAAGLGLLSVVLGAGACVQDAGLGDVPQDSGTTTAASDGADATTGEPSATVGSQGDGSSSESGDQGTEATGEPSGPLDCPEDDWPDDGSEVLDTMLVSYVDGWRLIPESGGGEPEYEISRSDDSPIEGRQTVSIRSDTASLDGFGGTFAPNPSVAISDFAGSRVRVRGYVKRIGVQNNAGLWVRFDAGSEAVFLDNGGSFPGYGTSDGWVFEERVFDIPATATGIAFGSILTGPGEILVSDVLMEIVRDDVPTTNPLERRPEASTDCLAPLGPSATKRLHVVQTEHWPSAPSSQQVEEVARDEEVLYAGVPTFRGSGRMGGFVGGAFHTSAEHSGARVRATVPVRGIDVDGWVRLGFRIAVDGEWVLRVSPPIELTDEWTTVSVVGELPEDISPEAAVGLEMQTVEGVVWAGMGSVERVSDDVPLSDLAPS